MSNPGSSPRGPWPTFAEYVAAVQRPQESFIDVDLRQATFEQHPGFSGPATSAGHNTAVFHANAAGSEVTLRCLTQEVPCGAERYGALAQYRRNTPLPSLAQAQWRERGIVVRGAVWPLVQMERLRGPAMSTYVRERLREPEALRELANRWQDLARELDRANIAHGDLQPSNVRITSGGIPRLLDLDAVWLPTTSHLHPGEQGHRNFQHPERRSTDEWGRHVDVFPAMVIYLSLHALAAHPDLWSSFNNGENLIFTFDDFVDLDRSIWASLRNSPNTTVVSLVDNLRWMCGEPADVARSLDSVLARGGRPIATVAPVGAIGVRPRTESRPVPPPLPASTPVPAVLRPDELAEPLVGRLPESGVAREPARRPEFQVPRPREPEPAPSQAQVVRMGRLVLTVLQLVGIVAVTGLAVVLQRTVHRFVRGGRWVLGLAVLAAIVVASV